VRARAAAGESSIYRDDTGRWHGYVSMGLKENGQRDRRHVSGAKRADVVTKVRALETKRDAGQAVAAGRPGTFADWLEHWLTTIAVGRVRASTFQGYESKIRVHIVPQLGHQQLDRLQPEHLEAFYAQLVTRAGLSGSSALICHRIIARALKVAQQRGRVARNVALLVDPPRAVQREVRPLTPDEARRLLSTAQGKRNGARWSVALALGLRQGEALGARWEHVDLDAGVWRVREQVRRTTYRHGCGGACDATTGRECPQRVGGLRASEPKTARGKRDIGLPPQMIAALRSHRQEQLAERMAAGSTWADSDLVFAQPNGKPIDSKRDWRLWKDLLSEAGVRDARVHDARHTAATLMLAQHVPARVVMEILGHSTIAVTQNIYQHVMPQWPPTCCSHQRPPRWHHDAARGSPREQGIAGQRRCRSVVWAAPPGTGSTPAERQAAASGPGAAISRRSTRNRNATANTLLSTSERTRSQSTCSRSARAAGSTLPKSQACSDSAIALLTMRSVALSTGICTDSTSRSSARSSTARSTGTPTTRKITSTMASPQNTLNSQSSGGCSTRSPASASTRSACSASCSATMTSTSCSGSGPPRAHPA
jgi:integrase